VIEWLQAASPIISSVFGKSKPPSGPAISSATQLASATFDNSGWTVATGKAEATATPPLGLPWTSILIAAVVGVLIWKRA
jgi:hypothetical protein